MRVSEGVPIPSTGGKEVSEHVRQEVERRDMEQVISPDALFLLHGSGN